MVGLIVHLLKLFVISSTELVELGKLSSRPTGLALKTPGLVHQLLCGKGVTTTRNTLELFAAAAVTTAVVVSHHALRVICGFERGSTD